MNFWSGGGAFLVIYPGNIRINSEKPHRVLFYIFILFVRIYYFAPLA